MAAIDAASATGRPDAAIPIRAITVNDLNLSLREGWNDFLAMRGDLIFLGLL